MKTPWILALVLVGVGTSLYLAQDPGGDTSTDDGSDDSGISQAFIAAWAEGVSIAEGVNPAYNNPGGLMGTGNTGTSFGAGLGIFSTAQAGLQALDSFLGRFFSRYSGDTILQATAIYILGPNSSAVASGNYPQSVINEAQIVANNLGASINDTLSSVAARF